MRLNTVRKPALVVAAALTAFVVGLQSAHASGSVPRVKCKLPAITKAPKLPAGYPKPAEVTYTKAIQAGPSTIV
jgi:hypothetical protein